jgi:hypothetical protein
MEEVRFLMLRLREITRLTSLHTYLILSFKKIRYLISICLNFVYNTFAKFDY